MKTYLFADRVNGIVLLSEGELPLNCSIGSIDFFISYYLPKIALGNGMATEATEEAFQKLDKAGYAFS